MSRRAPAGRRRGRGGTGPAAEPSAAAAAPDGNGSRLRRLIVPGVAVLAGHLLLTAGAFNPAPHSGGDNATYISLAHALLETGAYRELHDPAGLPHTKYPPVFPGLLAVWILLGATTWSALKTTAVAFSALSVAIAYLWAAERRGPAFGAAVAALFALSSATVDASHWILSEPPFIAFTLLSLWAFDRAARDIGASAGAGDPARRRWLEALAGAGAVLAYFTRSAGLPLLLAAAAWLAWRRRFRSLALFAAGAGVPALLWWVRARGVGEVTYVGEFWMVDPYDPALGRIGPSGLVGRLADNLGGYVTRHVPGGIVGTEGPWVALLGVGLIGLSLVGWAMRARRAPGVAELFLPLYAGLILLWPQVWSGDRFALPLFPLLFFYAGEALSRTAARVGLWRARAVAVAALLLLALPALAAWGRSVSVARACTAAARVAGPFGCYGPGVQEFVAMALWSPTALPEGAAVLSRKPSIFYVLSGVPSRTFPFSPDPAVLLAESEATGTRYVLVDQWDVQALRFVGEAVARRPSAFCVVGGFDPRAGAAGTVLLGILDDDSPPGLVPEGEVVLERCPEEMLGDALAPIPVYSSSSVPLLVRPLGE